MDVAQARAFLAVAEELHFGRAAQRLHIAQPPLSRTINRLERELGTRLFERSTRSVRLTSGGEALVGPARDILTAVRRAETAVRSADQGEVGLVRVAFAGVSTHRLVAQLARVMRTNRPGVHLELSSQNFAQPAMRRLLRGETDLALGRWDVLPAEISARVVMPDGLALAVPDTHRFAAAPEAAMADLSTDGFISLPPHEGSVLPDRLSRLSRECGFVADVVQIAPDTQTALALVGAEVGVHLTLASVAQNATDPHVAFVPLRDASPDVDLRVAYRTDDQGPALRATLAELLSLDVSPAASR
ncbi:LysR substrate-binding domain-containing protein [Solicola sp. PLA-1-18]|uniref:LysR substrate-binding domain-containing protein n=1 Tax=Solicola sp. PLA-1-18 TaxID=3380532 RepID=UPI003B7A9A4F